METGAAAAAAAVTVTEDDVHLYLAQSLVRILNCRLTQQEYDKATAVDRLMDDNKGDYEFTLKIMKQLEEDLWYILTE